MPHHRGEVGALRASQQLRAIEVRDGLAATKPHMRLGPRDASAKIKCEAVVSAALGNLGVQRREMEGTDRLVLQPHMRQRGILGDMHLGDRIVQISAVTGRHLEQRETRASRHVDGMACVH